MDFKVKTNIAHVRYIAYKMGQLLSIAVAIITSYRNTLPTTMLEWRGYKKGPGDSTGWGKEEDGHSS